MAGFSAGDDNRQRSSRGRSSGEPTSGGRASGDRDSRWERFAQGAPGEQAKPSARHVALLSELSGPDGRCAGAADDEVFGVLAQWDAVSCWVEGRQLAVVRELIRRRPDERNAGAATESGLPWDWDERLAREIALELHVSVPAAQKLAWAAWALEARLPRIGEALDNGRLRLGKVKMVIEETDVLLDPSHLAAAEELILAGLDLCKSWLDLQRLVQRAVVTVDPDGARKRRERAEKEHARVLFWREAAGTCALKGAGLPTDEALQAYAHVDQRAQQYRAAGAKRPIDILRVAAYLDLLNLVPLADRIARFKAEDTAADTAKDASAAAETARPGRPDENRRDRARGTRDDGDRGGSAPSPAPAPAPAGYPWSCPPDDGFPVAEDPCGQCSLGDCPCRDWLPGEPPCADCGHGARQCGRPAPDGTARDGTGSDGTARDGTGSDGTGSDGAPSDGARDPGSERAPGPEPAVAAEVNLILRHLDIPFVTAAGYRLRAGAARSLGTLDPALARRIAEAAARHPGSMFCLTIVNADGHAIGHGCCKPRKERQSRRSRKGQRDGPPPPPPPASAFTLTPSQDSGPPGGYGSWILTLPGRAAQFVVDLHPVPTDACGHQYESARHDPGDLLRHLVTVRDGTCGFPACSRPARESDFEHARPYDQGGLTCGCNCWSCSRSCHQVKQSDGWEVTEIRPGYLQWTTPSGRTFTQEPWRYPA
jgi:hypothetical protein